MVAGPRLHLRPRKLRLRAPLRTAWGDLSVREVLEVRLDWGRGDSGTGEAAPLEPRDGVPMPAVVAALDAYAEVLRRLPGAGTEELLAACRAERPLAPALAAIDLALWDRAGRAARSPVAALISDRAARSVPVSAAIAVEDPVFAAAEAYRAATAGFRCVTVRIDVGQDVARVAAVRQAVGPAVSVRVEAGRAWDDARAALARLEELEPLAVELAENVVAPAEVLRELHSRSPVPIAHDGVGAEPGDPAVEPGDVVCLRVSSCGGISALLDDARRARAAGARVMVGSNFDGPLGTAAGLHAASVLAASGPCPASGLATLGMFHEHAHMLPFDNGQIDLPTEPGLLGTTTAVR